MRYAITLLLSVSCFCFAGFAQTDVIKEELDRARAAYSHDTEAAKKKLIDATDVVVNKLAQRGELENVKAAKTQKERFEREGTLPTSPRLDSAKSDYEKDLRLAKSSLRKALEKAKVDYTKALKIPEAEAVAAELAQMDPPRPTQSTVSAVQPIPVPEDPFPAGSFWSGQVVNRVDGVTTTALVDLFVIERVQNTFRARLEAGQNEDRIVRDITGTIFGNKVSWLARNVKVVLGGPGLDNSGTISGTKLELTGAGLAGRGPKRGHPMTFLLTLQRQAKQ